MSDRTPSERCGDERHAHEGWQLVQLAQLVRNVEQLAHDVSFRLRGFDPEDLQVCNRAKLDPGVFATVLHDVSVLRDVAEQAGILADHLTPRSEALAFSRDDIAVGAARALARGVADPAHAMLAARVLTVEHGWRALAAALAGADTHPAWDPLTVGELVRTFLGADPKLVDALLAAARIADDRTFAALTDAGAQRLADALERHAPPRDPRVAWALEHPVRARIIVVLHDRGTSTAGELARELHLPTARVSYHFRQLREYGFIEVEEELPTSGGAVQHVYRLAAGASSDELLGHARRRAAGHGLSR